MNKRSRQKKSLWNRKQWGQKFQMIYCCQVPQKTNNVKHAQRQEIEQYQEDFYTLMEKDGCM